MYIIKVDGMSSDVLKHVNGHTVNQGLRHHSDYNKLVFVRNSIKY